jgi:putative DNA primase/helicase
METTKAPIIFNGHEFDPAEWTLINCVQCKKPYVWGNNEAKIIALSLCADCYRVEWSRQNKKPCRICGDHRLPKDSKEDTCDECKQDIKGGKKRGPQEVETTVSPTITQIILGSRKTEDGDEYSLLGRRASDIPVENIEWLYPRHIPLGKTTIFAGRPGSGKSMVAIDFAARVSRGGDWPDRSKNTLGPKAVLYFATEDGAADTLIPRLMAAGADLKKVYFPENIQKVSKATGRKQQLLINLANHIAVLEGCLKQNTGIGLVVLDPLTSFIGIDINKDKEARPLMDRLAKMLDSLNCSVICIVHHNKKSDVGALEKILGSSSLVGSARAIWDFSRDPDDRQVRHMSVVKLSIDEEPPGMKYEVRSKDMQGIKGAHVEWGEETNENADELLQRHREKGREKRESPAMTAASLFLKTELEAGEKKSSGDDGLIERGKSEGISKSALWRAKESLGIVHVRRGGDWYWSMGREEAQIPVCVGQVM